MIKNNKKTMKTLVFSLGLVALLLTSTNLKAQYDGSRGLFGLGGSSADYEYSTRDGLIGINDNTGGSTNGIQNDSFGTPLGSGIAILLAAGAGYAVVRRKRSRKNTMLLLACVAMLGFTQCKKEQPLEPTNDANTTMITLNVDNGGNNGSRVNVSGADVTFTNGDKILVVSDGHYVGTLTHNGTYFNGTITDPVEGKPLYFYFLGNKDTGSLTAGTSGSTGCTVNISDQTNYPHLPVISMAPSKETYPSEGNHYTASLHNKCSLMKLNVTSASTKTICITGMNNKVTIDFSKVDESGDGLTGDTDQGFSYSVDETDGGLIKMMGSASVERWIIVLPQAALDAGSDGTAYTNEETQRYKGNRPALDAISSNQYLSSGVSLNVNTEDNSTTVNLSKLVYHYRAKPFETLTGTLAGNYRISIMPGATITLSNATINGVHNNNYSWAGLNCTGNATINLANGTTNIVKGFKSDYPGILVPSGSTLTIQGAGTLNASSNGNGAGIGAGWNVNCGNIIIKNGTINASGGSFAAGIGGGYEKSCGTIEIQGGHVTATSSNSSAGIGGGYNAPWGDISISGGTVDATGSNSGAGIGAGSISSSSPNTSYGNISISGGTVTAHGGNSAAGIGTGYGQAAWGENPANPSYCGTITISGGTVEATGGNGGAGIGAGDVGNCGVITITNGTVTATGAHSGAGIGAGRKSTCGNISVQGGQITAYGGTFAAGIGTGHGEEMGENTTPSSCGTINISGGTIDATGGAFSAGIGTGNIGNCGNITITTGVTRVTAKKGDSFAENCVGTGNNGSQFSQSSYTVTIGGTLYWDGSDYQNNGYSYLSQSTLDYQP